MKNRVLNKDGSYSTYVAPLCEKPKVVAPLEPTVLEEKEVITEVKKDYTIMNAAQLKEECTSRNIEFKGNASAKTLTALLIKDDTVEEDVL